MQVTDSIADMLTRIRNANSAKHKSVDVPASRIKESIAKILVDEGFIHEYEIVKGKVQDNIRIKLKYLGSSRRPVLVGLKRVSKPGLRIYYGCKDIPKLMKGLGVVIVSTSKGIMTDKAARKNNVGGEIMAYIW